jgi:hypothetical protein
MKKFPIINTKLLETKKVIERIKLRKNYSNKLLEESNIKFMNKIKINKGQELDYAPINSYNGLETTLNTSESSPTSQISYISNYSLNKFKSEENICKVVKGQWKKKLDLEENFEFISVEKCNQFFNHVINFFNNENNHDSKNILDIVKKDYEQRLDNFKNNKMFNEILKNSFDEDNNYNKNDNIEFYPRNFINENINNENNILKNYSNKTQNSEKLKSLSNDSVNSIDNNNNDNFRELIKQQIKENNNINYPNRTFTGENKSSSSSITIKSFNTDSICESSDSYDLSSN